MPTTFFMRSLTSSVGGAGGRVASQSAGGASTNAVTTAVRDATNIQVTATAGGTALAWFTEPLTQAVTISGTVTPNIRGQESSTAVNAGAGILIQRCDGAGTVISAIINDVAFGLEWPVAQATRTASLTPTSTSLSVGDRIRIVLKVRNVGTMDDGTVTNQYNGPGGAGSAGGTFVTFTEDIRTDEVIEINQYQGGSTYGYI